MKTRLWRSFDLWRWRGGGLSTKLVLGSYATITIISGMSVFIFSLEIRNHSLSSIPTEIDQNWEICLDWRRIWCFVVGMTSSRNSVMFKFGRNDTEGLKSVKIKTPNFLQPASELLKKKLRLKHSKVSKSLIGLPSVFYKKKKGYVHQTILW